jgi:FMN phosphatase YigB (HAD superfamily)
VSTSAPSFPEVRAVICDLYGTLLKVLPAPSGAAERWCSGCEYLLPSGQGTNLPECDARCHEVIREVHRRRRECGELFPEVDWREILAAVFPGLRVVNRNPEFDAPREWISERAAVLARLHAACSRTCVVMPGARAVLEQLAARGVLLGVASNAQEYTRAEFTGAGFSFGNYAKDLTFLSYAHGFAKPSPRVFAMLSEALAARGISPAQALMVGDRADNDIAPAAAAGWQTWLFTEEAGDGVAGGTWAQLAEALRVS